MYVIRIRQEGRETCYGGSFCHHASAYNSMTSQICDRAEQDKVTVWSPGWDKLEVTIHPRTPGDVPVVVTYSIEQEN